MNREEFNEQYEDEIDTLRNTIRLSVIGLEILVEELEKSKLPQELKDFVIKNYKLRGE